MVRFSDSDDGGEPAPARPDGGLAPVISLFPSHGSAVSFEDHEDDHGDEYSELEDDGYDACTAIEREIAERNLTRRLRTRQLSVGEARTVVAERDLDAETVELVIERFLHLGYLDDATLAEQLVRAGSERKGQGRQAIAQTLAKRGIPRAVADAALAELPDDDAERALEFARAKARTLSGVERDAAVRRLGGQLARRGYSASTALTAARRAIDEVHERSGVRFR